MDNDFKIQNIYGEFTEIATLCDEYVDNIRWILAKTVENIHIIEGCLGK